jgi:hypothetical protein
MRSGGSNPMLVTGGDRPDWHATRKYAAAQLWYQQQEAAKEK